MSTDATTPRYFDIKDGRIFAHVREGNGPALVFLHYYGGSQRTWRPVIERLRPDRPYVAHDQRGWGESAVVPGPYNIDQLADDAQQIIDQLGYDEFVLVGHSMGGKAAQVLAARRPTGLVGVVLVAPAPAAPAGEVTPEAQDFMVHAYDTVESVHRAIDGPLTNGGLSDKDRAQVVDDSVHGAQEAKEAWPLHAILEDHSARVAAIDVPVLVLAGSDDKVDPPQVLREHLLPMLPTATLRELRGTGHLSPLEVPDQIATHIEAFVGSL
ncbi:alpha/beta fold hydrolase [Streptomyces sp. cg40]|uniref:alpha/beta fold hydrolase n=1 Tax=Streptomyces sp. cg40 TaxID=3419764 RepID=UPI003D007F77